MTTFLFSLPYALSAINNLGYYLTMRNQIKNKMREVATAILPLVLVVVILQFALVKMPTNLFLQFIIGAVMVIAGMVLFLLGVEIGILPMGKALGAELPRRGSLPLIWVTKMVALFRSLPPALRSS